MTTLSSLFLEQEYKKRLSKMSGPELNIQKRYWESLIDRYALWNEPQKLRDAQRGRELVNQEMVRRLSRLLQ